MALSIRSLVAMTLPAFGIIVGLIWFRRRKSPNSLDYPKPPDKETAAGKSNDLKSASELGDVEPQCAKIEVKPSCADVQAGSLEEELVCSTSAPVTCSAPVVQKDVQVLSENMPAATNDNICIPVVSDPSEGVTVKSGESDDSPPNTDANQSNSGLMSDEINTSGDTTSQLSWADSMDQEQSNNEMLPSVDQTDTVHITGDVVSTSVNEGLENQATENISQSISSESAEKSSKPSDSDPTLSQHSKAAASNIETSQNSENSAKATSCCTSEKSKVTKSKVDNNNHKTNSSSNEPMCINTEEEVSKTLTGEKLRAGSSAVSSESPSSVNSTLSSDSGCCDHDQRSEVSMDSGRGGSLVGMSSPITIPDNTVLVYEFDFPTDKCGMLIGKNGRQINRIKDLAGVEISVNHKMYTQEYQLVVLEGNQAGVDKALTLLRERFPIDRFPDVTLEPVQPEAPMLHQEMMQMNLPEGVYVDVLVSSVVSPNHVFLQQPTHPTFHMLETLNQCMNACYIQDNIVPQLPRPIEVGVICAAPMYNTGWYRSQIVQSYPETDDVELKFVDYGGYMTMQGSSLRQIRSDFSQLPFQAVECYMANVMPPKGQDLFPAECNALMEHMVQGKLLQAQVVGHEADGVPYIQLYDVQGEKTSFINRELVNSGSAQWIEHLL